MLFNYNGNFCTQRKKITEQADEALFAVYRKHRNISIPVDLQLKLFDSLVSPILVYGVSKIRNQLKRYIYNCVRTF